MGDFIMTTCSYIFKNINQRTYDFHKQNELEKKQTVRHAFIRYLGLSFHKLRYLINTCHTDFFFNSFCS